MLAQVVLEYEPEHSTEKDDWTVNSYLFGRGIQA